MGSSDFCIVCLRRFGFGQTFFPTPRFNSNDELARRLPCSICALYGIGRFDRRRGSLTPVTDTYSSCIVSASRRMLCRLANAGYWLSCKPWRIRSAPSEFHLAATLFARAMGTCQMASNPPAHRNEPTSALIALAWRRTGRPIWRGDNLTR